MSEAKPPGEVDRGVVRDARGFELLFKLQKFTTESERYAETVRRLHGLARNDIHALNAVMEAEREGAKTTPGAIRERLVLSSAAMTALLDRLEGSGHVSREHSVEDRRQVLLSATDSARTTGRQMFDPMVRHLLPVLADLDDAELGLLSRLMDSLTLAVSEAREEIREGAPRNSEAPPVS